MSALVSYMFTSLDGFIADRDGGLGWTPIDDELMGFGNTAFGEAGGGVFGRNVYRRFVDYWDALDPTDPAVGDEEKAFASIFAGMRRYVISRSLTEVPSNAVLIRDDLAGRLTAAKADADADLLLICGPGLRSELAALGLIDRYQVFVAPVVLGEGVPQFAQGVQLRLMGSREFGGGVVLLDYEPVPPTA